MMFSVRFPEDFWPVGLSRSKEANFWVREKKNIAFYNLLPPIVHMPFAGLNKLSETKGSRDFAQHVFACTHVFKLRQGASMIRFVGLSVRLSVWQKLKSP